MEVTARGARGWPPSAEAGVEGEAAPAAPRGAAAARIPPDPAGGKMRREGGGWREHVIELLAVPAAAASL